MVGRIIETAADVAEGAAFLARTDPRLAAALAQTGPLPLRRQPDGFAALLSAIISQQVSTAAAAAIRARLVALGGTDPAGLLRLDDAALRSCGLSRSKVLHARGLAESGLDFAALRQLPDAGVVAALTRLPGVGVWTAEVYAIVSLGRADVFAAGDLALQAAAARLFGLERRPGEAALRARALAWSPWRAVAARLLWAHYRIAGRQDGTRLTPSDHASRSPVDSTRAG